MGTKALFRSIIFLDFDTVALSFLFDKQYLIMEQLGLNNIYQIKTKVLQ